MSFPRYPEYKETGIEWLGQIPAHWDVMKLGFLGEFNGGAGFPDEFQGRLDQELPFFKVGDVAGASPGGAMAAPQHTISEETAIRLRARIFPAGTILFAKVGAALLMQRYRWLPTRACIDNNLMGMRVNERAERRFLLYLLPLLDLSLIVNPGAVPSINERQISAQMSPVPSSREQLLIVEFLDHETAKIDALVAEQEQLIALLKEKRQAVISHAVTKGLNPDAPMKDSGIAWIGEIPELWRLRPLSRSISEAISGPYGASLTKAMYTTSGFRVYGQQQVIANDLSAGDYYISESKYEEMRRYTVFAGDVLVTVMGTIGKVAVVPNEVEPGIINPRLVKYRCHDDLLPEFLKELLMSRPYQELLTLESQGTTMDGLNMGILGRIPLVLPPLDVQRGILREVE